MSCRPELLDNLVHDISAWPCQGNAPYERVFAMELTRLGAPHQNPKDWSRNWRSAFNYLDRWIKHGTPPTAPPLQERMNATEQGEIGKPGLDADGNVLCGIRLPPIETPRAVYTGFDFSWPDPAVSDGHRFAIVLGYGEFAAVAKKKRATRLSAHNIQLGRLQRVLSKYFNRSDLWRRPRALGLQLGPFYAKGCCTCHTRPTLG